MLLVIYLRTFVGWLKEKCGAGTLGMIEKAGILQERWFFVQSSWTMEFSFSTIFVHGEQSFGNTKDLFTNRGAYQHRLGSDREEKSLLLFTEQNWRAHESSKDGSFLLFLLLQMKTLRPQDFGVTKVSRLLASFPRPGVLMCYFNPLVKRQGSAQQTCVPFMAWASPGASGSWPQDPLHRESDTSLFTGWQLHFLASEIPSTRYLRFLDLFPM